MLHVVSQAHEGIQCYMSISKARTIPYRQRDRVKKNPSFHLAGNGYISTDVLKEILRELDNKLTEEDLDNIVDEVDEDSSGTLDFDGERS